MTRLLTLTGAGGRARRVWPSRLQGTSWGPTRTGCGWSSSRHSQRRDLVAQEVAGALGVPERPDRALIDTLVDALGDQELLLVLDNCEHLVEAAARWSTRSGSCPRLRVLATSREPWALGVKYWRVPPLSVPAIDGRSLPDAASTAESLMRYEAVRLFVDRVRLRLLDFGLTQENSGAVARVCRKLDGHTACHRACHAPGWEHWRWSR